MGLEMEKTYDPASVESRLYEKWEKNGYFHAEPDSRPGAPVFNRTVTLKDSWKPA